MAAPVADAKKPKQPRGLGPVKAVAATGNVSSGAGIDSVATAVCPSGTRVVSGGFSAPYAPGSQLVVLQSFRSSKRAWTAAAKVTGGSGAVIAFAYCRKGGRRVTASSSTGLVPGGIGQYGGASSSCPPGELAISGGFQLASVGSGEIAHPIGSGTIPGSDGWGVLAFNRGTAAQVLNVFAYCTRGIRTPVGRQRRDRLLSVAAFGSVTAAATCPVDKAARARGKSPRVIASGGFSGVKYGPPPASMPIQAESRLTDGHWYSRVVNPGPGNLVADAGAFSLCF